MVKHSDRSPLSIVEGLVIFHSSVDLLRSDLFTGLISYKIHVELNFMIITVTVTSGSFTEHYPRRNCCK